MRRHALRGTVVVAALAAATSITWAAGMPSAQAEPECINGSNDFNADGGVDVAVGMPGANDGAGAVEVRVTEPGGGGTTVHRIDAPSGQPGDNFGAAVAEVAYYEGTANTDTCTQLVVGAPGRDAGGEQDAGSVFLYEWNGTDQGFNLVKAFSQATAGVPGDPQTSAHFGAALASPYHAPDQIERVVTPLYVGVPGADEGAGGFVRMSFTGGDDPTATDASLVTQDTEGVPGASESGDHLGASLAVVNGGVLAGVPMEDIGRAENAGGVVVWHQSADAEDAYISQETAGVPGVPEKDDHFGATVYSALETTPKGGGHYALIGVPREDIGQVSDAGSAVRLVARDGAVDLGTATGFNQGTSGVKGAPERGDQFGSSFGSYGLTYLLAGAPGEDVEGVEDAGAVQALTNKQGWNQGTGGMPGKVEAGDRFGQTMGNALYGMGSSGEDGWLGAVLVGVPGENDGAGAVNAGLSGGPGRAEGWSAQSPQSGDRYGTAIGKTN